MAHEHPLRKFAYCPRCGSAEFYDNDERSRRCAHCGFIYYLNPSAATAAVIWNENGELLAVRRAQEPQKGWLDLPGGFCDLRETAEEGLRREIKEETGLELCSMYYLMSEPNTYEYSGFVVHTLDLFFECRIVPGTRPKAMDDASEVLWLRPQEIDPEAFAFASVRRALRKIL